MERAATNKPAKLGRSSSSKISAMKAEEKMTTKRSRNPLKELNSGFLPPHSKDGSRRGCFGRLLSNSSSSSSSSFAGANLLPKSKSLPRTPTSAPPNSRAVRPLKSSVDQPGHRSVLSRKNQSRPSFEILKHSGSDRIQRPDTTVLLQRWSRGKPGGRGKSTLPTPEVAKDPAWELLRRGRELPAAISQVSPGNAATPASSHKLSYGSSLDDHDGDKGDQIQIQMQNSQTPTSTRTATPPVQATISPELASQSILPTPACFAAGHLIAGVQDRRKCRPRGILNGGSSGLDIADSKTLESRVGFSGKSQGSLTPPRPLGASVRWHSSPCNGEMKKLDDLSPSVSWFLDPEENSSEKSALQNTPCSSGTTPSSVHHLLSASPTELVGSLTLGKTPTGLEIFRSPASSSGLSPFSMILQKASAMPRFKGFNLSPAISSPFSGDSPGNSNVMCTPSSCSSSSKHVREFEEEAIGIPSSSPPHLPNPYPAESFRFGCPVTPLSSVDLSRFQRPSCLQSSAQRETSGSEMRISWREGLISRIFGTYEFAHSFCSPEKEDGARSSEQKINGENAALGFGSFEFSEQRRSDGKGSVPGRTPCAESLQLEENSLTSSDDSDWTLFFKNQLFED